PTDLTPASLWGLCLTWGGAYACFFILLAARRCPMPAACCWLGRISYSVYLLHPLVLRVLMGAQLPAWALLPALLAGALALADLAYRWVGARGIALGGGIDRRCWPGTTKPSLDAVGVSAAA